VSGEKIESAPIEPRKGWQRQAHVGARIAEPEATAPAQATDDANGDGSASLAGLADTPLRVQATRSGRGPLIRRALLLADVSGLLVAFALTEALFRRATNDTVSFQTETLVFVATLPLWLLAAQLYGLYERDGKRPAHSTIDDFVNVFHLVTVGIWVFFAASWFTSFSNPSAPKLAAFWLLAIVLVVAGRAAARGLTPKHDSYSQNTIIVGAGDVGQLIGRKLLQHPEYGLNLIGFVDADPKERRSDLDHLPTLGEPEELPEIVERLGVERVVIAFSNESHDTLLDLIHSIRRLPVHVDLVPRLFEAFHPSLWIHDVEGIPLIGLTPVRYSPVAMTMKRALDVTGAGLGLLLAAPLFAFIALRIKLDSPGPVIF
jgi:FlaA1/EpsC-like NDP-sugar epimerase